MQTHAPLRASLCLLSLALGSAPLVPGCDCDAELQAVRPSLSVDPERVELVGVPVAQDTIIVLAVLNKGGVELHDVHAELADNSDPAFTIVSGDIDSVLPQKQGQLVIQVRPTVATTFSAVVTVTAEEGARPNHIDVPITITSVDAGLPDIEVDPAEVVFDRIGRTEVGRASVVVRNVGVRDLILDSTTFAPADPVDETIRLTTPAPPGQVIGPRQEITLQLTFAGLDLLPHTGELLIASNDPDETFLRVPVIAQAADCPVAVAALVDEGTGIEPFDTVRIDGRDSQPVTNGTFIERWDWRLEQRPVGSTAVLGSLSADRNELEVDLAGRYVVALDVYDNTGVRSCAPAVVPLDVIPKEQLHIQLVWDSPDADLDLHVLRDGGTVFTHEGDCYFSNRDPEWFPEDPEASPFLDVDDDRGYGPENANIIRPQPGSRWTILVHYWNAQTDGDPGVTATLRIFAYGRQTLELRETFADDQQMWRAIELTWGNDEFEPPAISQLGVVEPFVRPF